MTNYDILKEYEAHGVPVPSYEEWKALNESYDSTVDANLSQATWMVDMEKENAQLKELLKDIRDSIAESQLKLTPEGFKLITEIVAIIDEVLK